MRARTVTAVVPAALAILSARMDVRGQPLGAVLAPDEQAIARCVDAHNGEALALFLTAGDEEDPGEPHGAAREALVAAAKEKGIAIGFEDGAMGQNSAIAARRGTASWLLRAAGTGR